MNRPYADDWQRIHEDLLHSPSLGMWFVVSTQRNYDETSAQHNGIIGQGARLKELLKNHNK